MQHEAPEMGNLQEDAEREREKGEERHKTARET